jgi:Na+-driven multidrug efflux pump
VTGLPFLLMTVLLLAIYAFGKLDDLSLPLSFLAGFGVVGGYALFDVVAREWRPADWRSLPASNSLPAFQRFLRQLTSSSLENLGYSANQILLVFFMAKAGTGAVSANTCAMRVGMLGFSLLGQPLAQLVQAKLCAADEKGQADVFKKWMWAVLGAVLALALVLYVGREPIVSLVYLRGKFSVTELNRVLEIMPAWLAYFVVASLNAIAARYLFAAGRGSAYVRRQLIAYSAANLARLVWWGQLSAPLVVWCSVVAEGGALLVHLRDCFQASDTGVLKPQFAGAQEA